MTSYTAGWNWEEGERRERNKQKRLPTTNRRKTKKKTAAERTARRDKWRCLRSVAEPIFWTGLVVWATNTKAVELAGCFRRRFDPPLSRSFSFSKKKKKLLLFLKWFAGQLRSGTQPGQGRNVSSKQLFLGSNGSLENSPPPPPLPLSLGPLLAAVRHCSRVSPCYHCWQAVHASALHTLDYLSPETALSLHVCFYVTISVPRGIVKSASSF